MKKKLFGIIVLATLVSSFMLGGCNQQLDQSGDANGEGIQKKKDELVMAFGSEPEAGFDPTTGWGRYGSPLFQSTLLKRDNKLNIVNDIATSYKVRISIFLLRRSADLICVTEIRFPKQGVKTNVTLLFSANQALLAARAGATYVSPFLGRLDDIGQNGLDLISDIAACRLRI